MLPAPRPIEHKPQAQSYHRPNYENKHVVRRQGQPKDIYRSGQQFRTCHITRIASPYHSHQVVKYQDQCVGEQKLQKVLLPVHTAKQCNFQEKADHAIAGGTTSNSIRKL